MKATHLVLGMLLILGILLGLAPSLEPVYGAGRRSSEAQSSLIPKPQSSAREETRRERNKKFMAGMKALPDKVEAMMKRSPDFSGS